MSVAELIPILEEYGITPSNFPHGSNLLTKARGKITPVKRIALELAIPAYIELFSHYTSYQKATLSLEALLAHADAYYQLIRGPEVKCFSHQSDFISSLLPEILGVLLLSELSQLDLPAILVTAQKDVVIECNFDISSGGRIIEKRKRMDLAVLIEGTLSFNGEKIDFSIPALCAEIKTNIDKNMLSGIEASVETLKRTFPRCLYFAIGEFSDFSFDTQNYASTKIDEILIIRNQRRSVVRKNPEAINQISVELVRFFLDEVRSHVKLTISQHESLAIRMARGKLT